MAKKTTAKAVKVMSDMALRTPIHRSIEILVLGSGFEKCHKTIWIRNTSKPQSNNIVFNPVENVLRYRSGSNAQKVKMLGISTVCVTHNSLDTSGGLRGFFRTLQNSAKHKDGLNSVHIFGPPGPDQDATLYESKIIQKSFEDPKRPQNFKLSQGDDQKSNSYSVSVQVIPIFPKAKTASGDHHTAHTELDYEQNSGSQPTSIEDDMCMSYICQPGNEFPKIDLMKKHNILLRHVMDARKNNQPLVLGEHILMPDEFFETRSLMECFLVVGCPSERHLLALRENEIINDCLTSKERPVSLVIHFTPRHIEESADYGDWINSFGKEVHHMIINDKSPGEAFSLLRMQNITHNYIHDGIFPQLHTPDDSAVNSTQIVGNRIYPESQAIYRFFDKTGVQPKDIADHIASGNLPVDKRKILQEMNRNKEFVDALLTFKRKILSFTEKDMIDERKWPEVVFLGTNATLPISRRNTMGILVNISEEKSIILDPSAGTRDQLLALYGFEGTNKLLTEKLTAIFISHKHADHWLGADGILYERWRMLKEQGLERDPVTVFCGSDMMPALQAMHGRPGVPTHQTYTGITVEDFAQMENSEHQLKKHGLKYLNFPRVRHSRNARGVVFVTEDDYKVSFSGDTAPCKSFAEAGAGSDLLIHDATFLYHDINEGTKNHSTQEEALQIGEQMEAKFTMLTHFSAIFNGLTPVPLEPFKGRYSNYGYAQDLMKIRPCDLHIVKHLTPVFAALDEDGLHLVRRRHENKRSRSRSRSAEG